MSTKAKSDPLWFKDAVVYELSVRAFCDSNGDGIGDFQGVISKMDYLEDLGINTIWLLPFFPSPLRDDGFDVTEHCDIHPDYGTLSDFKQFLKEAHNRGMRVISELILNHTSDQHPWFQKSRRAKAGTRFRDYYVWSNTSDKYKEARVMIPSDEQSNWAWDVQAKSYYWHRFHRHQPDLNYDNPEVQLEMFKVIDFWMKLGVDGFRLGSVPFLFEQDGTSSENLPQTHQLLKKIRAHINKHYDDRVLMAEVNMWPEDSAEYFGDSDECNMCFNYSLMPRLFLGLRTEDSYPIIDILEQTPETPEQNQWALFLRNHDEIGLEMVTEEEKDYLFKAYANDPHMKHNLGIRRRLAPMLNNDRRKIELMYALLFSLPGTPIIYYGDEIGMGDNIYLGDRHGVRTPMQWSMGMNAGFSNANPQKLFLPVVTDPVYRYESVNVAMQDENPSSLMWWIKNVLAMRKRSQVFGRGSLHFIQSSNSKVLCYVRSYNTQRVVVVANLSQFSQATTLDFSEFKEYDVTEAFSQSKFMSISGREYPITIGPYGYYWLQIDTSEQKESMSSSELPMFQSDLSWERTFADDENIRFIERKVLQPFLRKTKWFAGKMKTVNKIRVDEVVPIKTDEASYYLFVVEVHHVHKLPEFYVIPVSFAQSDTIFENVEYNSQSILCRADFQGKLGFLIDSNYDRNFRDFLFQAIDKKMKIKTDGGTIDFNSSIYVKLNSRSVDSKILKADQNDTAIIYNDEFFFKAYRRVEREMNPDLEIARFLSENTSFTNSPKYVGSIEYNDNKGRTIVLGLLELKVENQGDTWKMATDSVGRFYERVMTGPKKEKLPKFIDKANIPFEESPELIQELIGQGFHERVVRLGQRTAEMHLALASDQSTPAFAPENFTINYQRSLYSSLRKLTRDKFKLLEQSLDRLNEETKKIAKEVLGKEELILECFSEIHKTKLDALKTRIHGDYNLEQVLFTGKDFVITDFKGEPDYSFSERRLKKNPFKDVAGMMRSFHYAAFAKILLNENYRQKDIEFLSQWAELWQHYVSRYYLGAYLERAGANKDLSGNESILIRIYLLEKVIYELGYELDHRKDWVMIPLRGILYQLEHWHRK